MSRPRQGLWIVKLRRRDLRRPEPKPREGNGVSNEPLTPQEQFDRDFDAWLEHMEEEIQATRESEILTAEDYAIRINAIVDWPAPDAQGKEWVMAHQVEDYLNKPYSRCFIPEDSGYSCYVRELHGCLSQGDTLAEASLNLEVAMRNWVEASLSQGHTIPEPSERFWEREQC
jgi:predicted RNase H-like HicB family nuclease